MMTDEQLQAVRAVLPDGDWSINGSTHVGFTEYSASLIASYRRVVRQGVAQLIDSLAADPDPALRRQAAATDVDRLADRLFERDMLPKIEAHLECGEQIFEGRSVEH